MQIKTTTWYRLTPDSELSQHHQKGYNNKCWRGCGEKGALPTLLVGMYFGAATVKNSGRALKTENRDTM